MFLLENIKLKHPCTTQAKTEKIVKTHKKYATYIACAQAPVGDGRVQSRANGMNRERSGEEGVSPRPTRFARGVTTL